MLHQGNKVLYSFLLSLLIVSCTKYKEYNVREIQGIRQADIYFSQSIIGEKEYFKIYNLLNDSIKCWINNQLNYFEYYNQEREWLLDSVLCINLERNKLITSVLKRSISNESTGDFIDYFYGTKIADTWYFFMGPHLVLPREYYQKDIHTPLSFEKLKQIATMNIYRGYLIKNINDKWEINDRFFSDLTSGAWSSNWRTNTQEQWDSIYISIVNKKWEDHWKAEQEAIENQRKAEIMERYYNSLKK
jgi:hypothetical protein